MFFSSFIIFVFTFCSQFQIIEFLLLVKEQIKHCESTQACFTLSIEVFINCSHWSINSIVSVQVVTIIESFKAPFTQAGSGFSQLGIHPLLNDRMYPRQSLIEPFCVKNKTQSDSYASDIF